MSINQAGLNVNVKVNLGTTRTATAPTQPVTLKSTARTVNYLNNLLDVQEVAPQDGFTLVYNSATDKYEVKQLSSSEINITSLDGGTF